MSDRELKSIVRELTKIQDKLFEMANESTHLQRQINTRNAGINIGDAIKSINVAMEG